MCCRLSGATPIDGAESDGWTPKFYDRLEAAGDAHYRAGFNAVNFHLLFKWALTEDLSLYAGVRQFDALTHEVRRQTRARARRDETDFTYFAVGIIWCF